MKSHVLGFPRIGAEREWKHAIEAYWSGRSSREALERTGRELRARHWAWQRDAGLDLVSVGDFAPYDHVLATSVMLGAVPDRFGRVDGEVDLDTELRMARGRAPTGEDAVACEMTKWFDTNYHYLVPEFTDGQVFALSSLRLFREVGEAQALGHAVKVVLTGPLTWLWLGKQAQGGDKLELLPALLPVYGQILDRLAAMGVTWVQIDEPILSLDLPAAWQFAFESAYNRLQRRDINVLLATYFGALESNLWLAARLPVAGLHLDVTRSGDEWRRVLDQLSEYKVLSLGVVDGRNIWRNDFDTAHALLREARARLGDRLWVATGCSLLHVPVDLETETALSAEVRACFSFARQKLAEVAVLCDSIRAPSSPSVVAAQSGSRHARRLRGEQGRWVRDDVRARVQALTPSDAERASSFALRAEKQQERLRLPAFPTTTIGSFPQTLHIRQARAEFRRGIIDAAAYEKAMQAEIATAVAEQELLGLDVLVHGEAERNDMVEYFGGLLEGFVLSENGWVQSYGSRCVKPPIIVGDVSRPQPMTVAWIRHAQSLTQKPVKGMLTGPVTLLCWSFVRDDLPRAEVALQLALAVRDEVHDLEAAGVAIIQVDEPAFREGLPLRRSAQPAYWDWAVRAFRVSSCGVRDETQIHTHMCYSEFNDSIAPIAAMDADVITIETARSGMELLRAFEAAHYPNAIGPGVYDIHSPRIPATEAMTRLLRDALCVIPAQRLWVNPDCGLKTRDWPETRAALAAMVQSAQRLRADPSAERDTSVAHTVPAASHAACCHAGRA